MQLIIDDDLHCVSYDGDVITDNNQYKKVKEIDEDDYSSPEKARKVFDSVPVYEDWGFQRQHTCSSTVREATDVYW